MKNYLIRLCKPEFKTLVLEVEADSAESAALEAYKQATVSSEQSWKLTDDADYMMDVQMILPTSETSNAEDREFIEDAKDSRYLMLKAECDTGEGGVLMQPWVHEQDHLLMADLIKDWQMALDEAYEEHLAGFTEQQYTVADSPLPMQNVVRRKAKIIPFPSERRR